MSAHRSCEDDVATALLPEYLSCRSCAVIGATEVHIDNPVPVFELIIETPRFRWDTGIGNHDIQSSKISDHGINGSLDLRLSARLIGNTPVS